MGGESKAWKRSVRSRAPWPRRRAAAVSGLLLAPIALLGAGLGHGATLVFPSDRFEYFWQAVDAAQPGETVRLLPGAFYAGHNLVLKDGLVIVGSGPSQTTLHGAVDYVSVFKAENVRGVLLEGLTILASRGERKALYSSAQGGALLCISSEVTIRNCVIAGGNTISGTANGYGGAIYATEGSRLSLHNCQLRDNQAYAGGAIYLSGYPSGASLTMTGCVLQSNCASGYAGAIRLSGPGHMGLESCRIVGNSGNAVGGIYSYKASVSMTNCVMADNVALGGQGAALYAAQCDFTATNCLFGNNVLGDGATHGNVAGAAIYCSSGPLGLTNCTVAGNKILETNDEDLYRRGGGIFLNEATAKITNCIFWDNTQDISYTTTSQFDVSYCDTEDFFPGVGMIHSPPRFVDAENGDFRLLGDSPCIDQGNNHPDIIPETDIEGKPRIIFGGRFNRPDLGTYEYDPSLPLQICRQSLDGSIADHEYEAELRATGGFGPYSWSLASGTLPAGLQLSQGGILSGIPTAPGTCEVVLSVTSPRGEEQQRTYQLDISGYQHWYVDANVGSPGDGKSSDSAFGSIQDAVESAGRGDIVHVAPGRYLGPIEVDVPIDLLGPGQDQATIDGQQAGSAISFWLLPFGKLSGFSITNGLADKGGGLFLYESGIAVEECTVESNGANYLGGGVYANLSPAKFKDCIVRDNVSGLGTYYATQAGGGIYSYFSPLEIDRCVVQNNGVIQAGYPYWGGGLTLHGSHPVLTNSLIVKNYLDSPSDYKLGAGIFALFGSPAIINCTIADNFVEEDPFFPYRVGGIGAVECGIAIVNCILWGNGIDLLDARAQFSVVGTPPEWAEGKGNINVDPEFVSAVSNNYRLKDSSPCIDAAHNLYIEGYETDLKGNARILNGLVDIGAYENPKHEFGRLVIAKDADTVTLTWNSLPGETYAVETSRDLLQWEFAANESSAGLYTSWVIPGSLLSPEFYRVFRLQP